MKDDFIDDIFNIPPPRYRGGRWMYFRRMTPEEKERAEAEAVERQKQWEIEVVEMLNRAATSVRDYDSYLFLSKAYFENCTNISDPFEIFEMLKNDLDGRDECIQGLFGYLHWMLDDNILLTNPLIDVPLSYFRSPFPLG